MLTNMSADDAKTNETRVLITRLRRAASLGEKREWTSLINSRFQETWATMTMIIPGWGIIRPTFSSQSKFSTTGRLAEVVRISSVPINDKKVVLFLFIFLISHYRTLWRPAGFNFPENRRHRHGFLVFIGDWIIFGSYGCQLWVKVL